MPGDVHDANDSELLRLIAKQLASMSTVVTHSQIEIAEFHQALADQAKSNAMSATPLQESILVMTQIGIEQKASFDQAMLAMNTAQSEQKAWNTKADEAIKRLNAAVAELQQKIANGLTEERPHKSLKTPLGKGTAPRASSAEPSQQQYTSAATEGDPFKAHVLLNEEYELVSSRLHSAVVQLVRSKMPTHCDFHVKARSRAATVTFSNAGDTTIFVSRCFDKDENEGVVATFIQLTTTAGEIVKHEVRVKHDEPYHVRRRKFVASRVWQAITTIFASPN